MNIKCLIVEDEPKAASLLEEYIHNISFLELCHKANNAMEALDYLNTAQVDLAFMDINMPGLSGLDLSDLLKGKLKVIFTTAYSEYAVQSYEKNAIDYLLKPITFQRFMQASLKAKEAIKLANKAEGKEESKDTIFLKSGKKIVQLNWSEIYYLEGYQEYVAVVTDHEKILVYKRMKEMEKLLPPQFMRVHNSFIVNITKVKKVEDNHIYILEREIPVSRKYKEGFYDGLQNNML
ncbi:LytR/AlgR family response regulator transcription factor [Pontibacter cellulosilyticus]|uniref:Response regulator transcription factor n=1 Tax=Pontibacter cellulosilyticus TaxID=1720253 RepID=A0A923N4Q6_9BACT|nr:LytTR family DNA-binding domain-containing protein [Pontibacter cellulosilyticus]MBC5992193.1 response regulator transcription factor [Pontibacter cellulosilyticus]